MRPLGDDGDEMTLTRLDDAFERVLRNGAVPQEAAALAQFAAAVRDVSSTPGRPGPELAELLATGFSPAPGTSSTAACTDPAPEHVQAPGISRRRNRMFAVLAAAAAKFGAAGGLAKAAAGAGIALASVTGAASAGVLPASVQDPIAGAVEAVTPFDLPESTDEVVDPAVDPADPATDPTDPATDPTDPATDPTDPATDPTDPVVGPPTAPPTDPPMPTPTAETPAPTVPAPTPVPAPEQSPEPE